jgi:endoglucanase
MKRHIVVTALLLGFAAGANAQLMPQDAVKGMERGINIGNTMEPPQEGWWGNPPVQQRAFDDYKNAGFTAIRIPITWDAHTSNTPPYTIDSTWMARVDTVVSWGLRRGLLIIINAHHETWLKTALADTAKNPAHADSCVARFDSIWSQIATHFKDKSDSLIFEMINEPYPMADSNVNKLNARVLKIIRETNPTRIVAFSGYMWSNSDELVTAEIPDTSDKFLIGYYHSYDPWPFGLQGPGTYGSASDIAATKAKFDQVTTWSTRNNIPVILGEFGYMKNCAYNSRMCAYATVVDQALQHGVGAFAWDDGGDFPIYNRTTYGFNEIKDILIYTFPGSPNGMKISQIALATVRVQWHNRNAESDSIVVQRRIGSGSFADYAEGAPTDSIFIDSSTTAGKSYYYRLKITMKDSVQMQSYPVMLNVSATAVNQASEPLKFGLSENYPNPFNPTTVINYKLSALSDVTLKVYDILGRQVATLAIGRQNAGSYTVTFNAGDLASGVYFYRLVADGHVITKKMILLK